MTTSPASPEPMETSPPRAEDAAAFAVTCYADLRAIAGHLLRGAPADHSLSATAAVHEAVVRVMSQEGARWSSRGEFLAYGARAIRSVLVDHARRRLAAKRGGGTKTIASDTCEIPVELTDAGLIELDEALESLRALSERQHRVVELRFFGQLSVSETAGVLGVSEATVKTDWRCARAWLRARLTGGDHAF